MTLFTTIDSPLGTLLLVGEDDGGGPRPAATRLTAVTAPGRRGAAAAAPDPSWRHEPGAFAAAAEQLAAYFAGELTAFSLPLAPVGTDFRQRVWRALDSIPYGTTVTYGELTAAVGASPRAVRAVGGAVGANPLLVVRPCHRVVGANGSLTGFAAGLDSKRLLLDLERGVLF